MKNPSLYIVGTPIGNLGDISKRALETLEAVDFIAAEDTRNSIKLLNRYGIKKPLVSYYEHNKAKRGGEIIERLLKGESCAIITDAGMPAISDPGQDIVSLCIENNIPYTVIPGPTAAISALSMSGLESGRFCFEGFLSAVKKERVNHLKELANEKRTMIFYEAPHKLKRTLEDMKAVFGDRRIFIAREITKLFEEGISTTLDKATELYSEKEPKGEFVLILEGGKEIEKPEVDIEKEFEILIKSGKSPSEAVKEVALKYGLRKNEVYQKCIK